MTLREKLVEAQLLGGYSDGEFARMLQVSYTLWRKVRRNEAQVGIKLLRGVSRAFPELKEYVWEFLES